jgi:hypothetical protein
MKKQIAGTKIGLRNAVVAALFFALLPATALSHGGEEHVTGTVAKVSDNGVSVKTVAGKTVEVGFDPKMTSYERDKHTVGKSDVKVGDRVVIHAMEVNEKLVAHTVELGSSVAKK